MANNPLPYNPNVLQQFTDRMLNQTVESAVSVDRVISKPAEPEICLPPTQEYRLSMNGLFGALTERFTPEARAERARVSLEKIQATGDQLRDPRGNISDLSIDKQELARKRIGWPGTRNPVKKVNPEDDGLDFENAGFSMMYKPAPWRKVSVPNPNTPTTPGERKAEDVMARTLERKYDAGDQARWLARSYDLTSIDSLPVSVREKHRLRSIAKKAIRLQKKHDKRDRKFERIATNNTFRGRLLRATVAKDDARTERSEEYEE